MKRTTALSWFVKDSNSTGKNVWCCCLVSVANFPKSVLDLIGWSVWERLNMPKRQKFNVERFSTEKGVTAKIE